MAGKPSRIAGSILGLSRTRFRCRRDYECFDLYLMPAYDDIASLYLVNGEWRLHYMFASTPTVATLQQADAIPLSKETIARVLNEMSINAAAL